VILTVTPNPAIDVTYWLDRFERGVVSRVDEVSERIGGKGVNVAQVLHQLGEPVIVTGLSGGPAGVTLASGLVDLGIEVDMVDVLPDLRRTIVLHESDGTTTSLWEPGRSPPDPAAAANALVATVTRRLPEVRAAVVSGSLPRGVDRQLPGRLVEAARTAGVPVVVDVDGVALEFVAAIGGAVLTPNSDEVTALVGTADGSLAGVVTVLRALVYPNGPVPAVVLTRGADGLVVVLPDLVLAARPPGVVDGNPTGAGDAVSAALARHLATAGSYAAVDWRSAIADAVAVSAAAVRRPVAGEIDKDAYDAWRHEIVVEEL
jgi:tagatose 6-phosphate kinase